jgi:hypothetical protein
MITTSQRSRSAKEGLLRVSNRRHLYTSCLAILLLTAAAINVLLAREITGLTAVIRQLKLEGRMAWQPHTGQIVPPIEARRMDGTRIKLDSIIAGDKPTIVYVFSPSCKWCDRNLENIRAVAARMGEKFQLVGLSVTERNLQEYVARSGLAFPVYAMMPSNESNLSRGTPRTLVVSREGEVIASWFGAYGGGLRKKVEEYFQLSLPGLSEDEPAGHEPGKLACE